MQNFAAVRQRHGFRRVDRAPHIVSRNLPVFARHGDHAAAVEPFDVRTGDGDVDRVDLDAGHQLGFVHRTFDRLDGRFEIHHGAAPDALRLGDTNADDLEAAVVHQL